MKIPLLCFRTLMDLLLVKDDHSDFHLWQSASSMLSLLYCWHSHVFVIPLLFCFSVVLVSALLFLHACLLSILTKNPKYWHLRKTQNVICVWCFIPVLKLPHDSLYPFKFSFVIFQHISFFQVHTPAWPTQMHILDSRHVTTSFSSHKEDCICWSLKINCHFALC